MKQPPLGSINLGSFNIILGSSIRNIAHHRQKLLEVDFTVSVFIHLRDCLVKLGLRVNITEVLSSEEVVQL